VLYRGPCEASKAKGSRQFRRFLRFFEEALMNVGKAVQFENATAYWLLSVFG
jgi:hypothetical protein